MTKKVCMYQNEIISLTGLAGGRSINNEFVKNSNLLLASRFFGILAAESFTVRRRCNRFTSSFCDPQKREEKIIMRQYRDTITRHFSFPFSLKDLTVSGSLGHSILEKRRPSFLALAKMFHVSSCSL